MTESAFLKRVHRQLPEWVEAWKILDDFHGGVADVQYFGEGPITLFAEYKYDPVFPKRDSSMMAKAKLSGLQQAWIEDKWRRGVRAVAIYGCPAGGVIITQDDPELIKGINKGEFSKRLVMVSDIAEYISRNVISDGYV